MKSRKSPWGELFGDKDDEEFNVLSEYTDENNEGIVFLEEAHEALNKLSQKANKRGKQMKLPRRAESWH